MDSATRLHEAILTNSQWLVKSYLEGGADPNECADMVHLGRNDLRPQGILVAKKHYFDKKYSSFAPIHAAVVNCCHNPGSDAVEIVEILLEFGAKPSSTVNSYYGYLLYNFGDYSTEPLYLTDQKMTPIDLAVFLEKNITHPTHTHGSAVGRTLDRAIEAIEKATHDMGDTKPNMVPLPKSVVDMLQGLLLSQDFSDIHFECNDGTTLPAHKNILASSSSYFRSYLSGPWNEQHESGVWRTSNSPNVMRAVLTFMYTGEVPNSLIESDPAMLLSVASEYELQGLVTVSEAVCIRMIGDDNVKDTLQLAHLLDSKTLKEECFKYIRGNAQVLTRSDMMGLAGEDEDLWSELKDEITPAEKSAKKSK